MQNGVVKMDYEEIQRGFCALSASNQAEYLTFLRYLRDNVDSEELPAVLQAEDSQ